MALQLVEGFAAEFRVRIDEIVQRIAFLGRIQTQIAPSSELDAIHIVRTEEIFALVRMLPGFGRVHWDPAESFDIKFRPAVIARNVAGGFIGRKRKTNFKARGDSGGAHHADEKRMEVRAIAALGCTSPDGVAVAPTFAG